FVPSEFADSRAGLEREELIGGGDGKGHALFLGLGPALPIAAPVAGTTPRIAGAEALDDAAALLRAGGIVAVPTETVYGLAAHVAASLGTAVPLILDGGRCEAGLESTIVALRADGRWQVLRPGPIDRERLAGILGAGNEAVASTGAIEAPGQLASHYAPTKRM